MKKKYIEPMVQAVGEKLTQFVMSSSYDTTTTEYDNDKALSLDVEFEDDF